MGEQGGGGMQSSTDGYQWDKGVGQRIVLEECVKAAKKTNVTT